ncbi:MAG: hypothetical protein U9R25_12900 [Chloroflexota bacterium]|nr:hypothetical protein [Chloroflexota bacterium]
MFPEREQHLNPPEERSLFHRSGTYCIRVQGVVSDNWSDYLQGMDIEIDIRENSQAVTILTGELVDQAALLGALNVLYNLRFPVLSVEYQATPEK